MCTDQLDFTLLPLSSPSHAHNATASVADMEQVGRNLHSPPQHCVCNIAGGHCFLSGQQSCWERPTGQ